MPASLYPCHCRHEAERCGCMPGRASASARGGLDLHIDGKHLDGRPQSPSPASRPRSKCILQDRLQIAAEYWQRSENFSTHWAAQWDADHVSRFVLSVTGIYPDTMQLNGKQLLRMAISWHARQTRVESDAASNEFRELVTSVIQRKRIIRILMQKSPPALPCVGEITESANRTRALAATPRDLALPLPSARLNAADEARDRFDALKAQGDRPILTVSGPPLLQASRPQRIEVKLSIASFLLQQLEDAKGSLAEPELLSARGTHAAPHSGIELAICPRFQHAGLQVNPARQTLCWLRQQHTLTFDLERAKSGANEHRHDTTAAQGFVEVWAGPLLVARVAVTLRRQGSAASDAQMLSALPPVASLLAETAFYHRVAVACSPKETAMRAAMSRAEASLRGCTSILQVIRDSCDAQAMWGTDADRANALIQISLSRHSQSHKAVLGAAETLVRLLAAAQGTEEVVPHVVVHVWDHPRPDLETNPVLARLVALLGRDACLFHKTEIHDRTKPHPKSSPADPSNRDFAAHAAMGMRQLAPGTPVNFQAPNSASWQRGTIVSVSQKDGSFSVVPENHGKIVHGVPEHQIRVVSASALATDPSAGRHRQHHGTKHQAGGSKRSRKRRHIFASLRVGDRVYARHQSGPARDEYHPGVIVALHKASCSADVAFDDGRAESHLDVRFVRTHPSQSTSRASQDSPRATSTPGDTIANMAYRASTGAMPHGTPVQILQSTGSAGACVTGRVRQALEYGLKYDVMLTNGDLVNAVPVRLLRRLDVPSSPAASGKAPTEHTYVDAMCDRYRQVIRDAALAKSNGKELRLQFDRLDLNRTGQLEAGDFLQSLHELGFKPSESEVFEFIDRMSSRKDGFVTYADFVRFALPHGVQAGNRQLKRTLAYYQSALEPSGTLKALEAVLQNRIGELWTQLADQDASALGSLREDVFFRCLQRLEMRANADQRAAIMRAFAQHEGHVDYREFAVVIEVLLIEKLTEASVQITTSSQTQRKGRRRAGELDEVVDAQGQPLCAKERTLRREINAATRIQALARRRISQRSVAIRKRQQARDSRAAEVWTGAVSSLKGSSGRPGGQDATLATSQEIAKVVEQWRKLLLLNTRNGTEVMTFYRAMDTNCDGVVSLEELSAALTRYSIDARRAGMILREMDFDGDGAVDLTDFKMFLAGAQHRGARPDAALASTQPGIHVMIDELGIDLCAKLRRYFAVLKRCGTDLLELLVYRPRGMTMTSVLRKQGFVLDTAEWTRLEVHFASMADHRGDRSVCEDFVRLLGMTAEELEQQQIAKQEHHLRDYLQKAKIDGDGFSGLGRLCQKVTAGIKDLCKDTGRANFKHETLWWLLALQEPGASLEMDRIDLERFLRGIKLRPTSFEMEQIWQALEPSASDALMCQDVAKLFGISRRIYEYLETDYLYSRYCRSYVMAHRARLGVEAGEALRLVRSEGSASMVRWLRDAIGVSAYRKFRAMVIASVSRGLRITSGSWMSERAEAKLGFCHATHFERVLLELGFGLSQDEIRNLSRALMQAAGDNLDLFAFADLCEVVLSTAAPEDRGGRGTESYDEEDEVSTRARTETERYLREVIQEYIRTPTGHRNLVQVFESFDTQRNGTLDQSELEAVFKSLGVDLAKVDTGALLRHYDVNRDGQLSYLEFLEAIDVRVHPVVPNEKKRVKYGGTQAAPVVQADLEMIKDKLEKYNARAKLCKEDVDDVCARVGSPGPVSRRDAVDVLVGLGLGQCLNDSELYCFSRLTRRKFKAFLMDLVKSRALRLPRGAQNAGSRGGSRGAQAASSSVPSRGDAGALAVGTKVVLKSAPYVNKCGTIAGSGRSSGTYDVSLVGNSGSDKLLESVKRSQFQVAGGRPAICENAVVIDKATQQRGIVIRFTLSDPSHVDVRFQNKICKHAASSSLEALPADVSVASLSRGRRVFALSPVDRLFYPGKVERVDARNGAVDVHFDHGEDAHGVALRDIKPISGK